MRALMIAFILLEDYKPRDKVVLTLALRNGEVVMLDDEGNVSASVVDDVLSMR
ncbi:MAG: hypothetical protein QXD59_08145 [Candidatus Caldarchaeum sp.]